jgi:hypothetical protein
MYVALSESLQITQALTGPRAVDADFENALFAVPVQRFVRWLL